MLGVCCILPIMDDVKTIKGRSIWGYILIWILLR